MSVTYNLIDIERKLGTLKKNVKDPSVMHRRYSRFMLHAVKRNIKNSQTPLHVRFRPLKDRSGRRPILGLNTAFKISGTKKKSEIWNTKPYSVYHQTGTSKMVSRPFFPKNKLPSSWTRKYWQLMEEHIKKD